MKKEFEMPEVEVIDVKQEDIVTTSVMSRMPGDTKISAGDLIR